MPFFINGVGNASISGFGHITLMYIAATISLSSTTINSIDINYILPDLPSYTAATSITAYYGGLSVTINGAPTSQSGTVTLNGLASGTTYNAIYIVVSYQNGMVSLASNIITTASTNATAATISLSSTTTNSIDINYTLPESPLYNTLTRIIVYNGSVILKNISDPLISSITGTISLTGLSAATNYSGIYMLAEYPSYVYSQSNIVSESTLANPIYNVSTIAYFDSYTWTYTIKVTYSLPSDPPISNIDKITIHNKNSVTQTNSITGAQDFIMLTNLDKYTYNIEIIIKYLSGVTSKFLVGDVTT